MGIKAGRFFEDIEKLGGLPAKMRLASLARVTSAEAVAGSDDEDILLRLEHSARTVRRELEATRGRAHAMTGPRAELDALRRQLESLRDLAIQRRLFLSDVRATARRVTETAAHVLDVARASVWFLDPAKTQISCVDLFERPIGRHSEGIQLSARDYQPYFTAMLEARTIAAADAREDPRTSCFRDSYLVPLGITSMLDVPLWVGEDMVGVLCHEQIGSRRNWSIDEESFAYLISTYVSLALERRRTPSTV